MAISWQEKVILLGEAKWSTDPVGGAVIRQLVEDKAPWVLAALPNRGEGWVVHFAFFAHAGFTEVAQAEAKKHEAMLVDLATLDRDLRQAGSRNPICSGRVRDPTAGHGPAESKFTTLPDTAPGRPLSPLAR